MKKWIISKKTIRTSFPVLVMTLYAFFFGLKGKVPGLSYIMFSLFFLVFTISLNSIYKTLHRGEKIDILTILCILIILLNRNNRFHEGNYLTDITICFMFYLFILLRQTTIWYGLFYKLFLLLGMFYALTTILFAIFPNIYINYIAPLFGGNYMLSMIRNAKLGYVTGFSNHMSTTAIYLSLLISLPISVLLTGVAKRKTIVYIYTGCLAISLLLTGKRGHAIFSTLSILVSYYIIKSDKKIGTFFKTIFGVTLLLALFFLAAQYNPALLNMFDRFLLSYEKGDITNGRIFLYSECIEAFISKPLFGIGWGGFTYLTSRGVQNAHNVYLQLLCENGILMTIPFIVFIATNLVHSIQAAKEVKNHVGASYLLVGITIAIYIEIFFTLYCITGNPLYDLQALCPYILACSIGDNIYRYCNHKNKMALLQS